jgi:hypothetical protein
MFGTVLKSIFGGIFVRATSRKKAESLFSFVFMSEATSGAQPVQFTCQHAQCAWDETHQNEYRLIPISEVQVSKITIYG